MKFYLQTSATQLLSKGIRETCAKDTLLKWPQLKTRKLNSFIDVETVSVKQRPVIRGAILRDTDKGLETEKLISILRKILVYKTHNAEDAFDLRQDLIDAGVKHHMKTQDLNSEYMLAVAHGRLTSLSPKTVVTYSFYINKKDLERANRVLARFEST